MEYIMAAGDIIIIIATVFYFTAMLLGYLRAKQTLKVEAEDKAATIRRKIPNGQRQDWQL